MKVEVVEVRNEEGNQSIPLPKDFAIEDSKVYLKKTGNIISIIPFHSRWQNLHESLSQFSEDFMEERNQPPDPQTRDSLD